MLAPEIRCVVGIDVAKQAHLVCALQAPSGAVLRKPSRIEATADGHAQLQGWLASWGGADTIVLGMEATGPLWAPLYDALTQAGYTVLLRESAPDRGMGHQLGAACQDGRAGCAHAGLRPASRDWPGPVRCPTRRCKRCVH